MNTHQSNGKIFMQRLNYYWQSIAIYAVALVLYAILKGTVQEGELSMSVDDPLVMLLFAFVIMSGLGLLFALYMRRSIIITADSITFRSRHREKTIQLNQIKRIRLARERRDENGVYKIVSISTDVRRRPFRVRPAGFDNEKEMIAEFIRIKKSLTA
ncbi:MAG TPA: hypothetical protein PLI74_00975 [Candidatus Kapabacteria bacterium]|nr:hypothetical protein [Ignavibacteria bacterium]HRK58187.1 hypothetical protein [Candidatus Kapabacteria bacterium]